MKKAILIVLALVSSVLSAAEKKVIHGGMSQISDVYGSVSAISEVGQTVYLSGMGSRELYEVLSVVDAQNMLLYVKSGKFRGNVFWLVHPTSSFFKGDAVTLDGRFESLEPKVYTTVAGSESKVRTLKVAKDSAEDLEKYRVWKEERIKNLVESDAAIKAQAKAEYEAQFREIKSADGKFSMKAKFIEYKKSLAWFEKQDGKVVSVKINSLSKDDADWVLAQIKEAKKLADEQKQKQKQKQK